MEYNDQLLQWIEKHEDSLSEIFRNISRIALYNQRKVLNAFHAEKIGTHHFQSTTGYGYNDLGREALENVFSRVFGTEAALVRQQMVSGTHAIACAILGNLKPSQELILATGYPYETLLGVLGIKPGQETVVSETGGFTVKVIPLLPDGNIDVERILDAITPATAMVAFQRSCGYSSRQSFTIDKLQKVFQDIKRIHKDLPLFVDNCYGEFVETLEPTEVGADLIAGSLIKNPGGCLIPSGGYIAGRADLVNKAAERLYAPKIAGEIGPSLLNLQIFFQGFFEAPHRVSDMHRGAVLTAKLFEEIGYRVSPRFDEKRTDIIQKIFFDSDQDLIDFCRAVQRNSPIESHVVPEPALLPGYLHPVIMGGGTFISGSTSEFSADAPLTPPYTAFMQGGLSYTQIKLSLAGIFLSNYLPKIMGNFTMSSRNP
ncbi:MAG TPA: methionine gamma-lyase family protein [Bacillota bacterium]|nr:methionine gamma-lyase family protein [Bacillota bacterium]HPT88139.1 methionine gamma-lyase family protein [Bacillota bacterium]